jgi:Holliday junction resolvase
MILMCGRAKMGKGSGWERKLANVFDDHDWSIVRAGGSGGGTSDDRPDVIVGKNALIWVIEAKFKSSRNIYVDEAEIKQIENISHDFGGVGAIAARWNTNKVSSVDEADWFMVPLGHPAMGKTASGRTSLNCDKITSECSTLTDILEGSDSPALS